MASLLRTKRLMWGVIFGLVTVMAWLSYLSGRRYLRAEVWVEHTLKVESTIDNVVTLVEEAEDAERGLLLTADPALIAECRDAASAVPKLLAELTELTHDNTGQQVRLLKLSTLVDEKLAFIEDGLRLVEAGERGQALQLVRSGRGVSIMAQMRSAAQAMGNEERRLLDLRKLAAERAQIHAIWGIGVGSALTMAVSFVSLLSVHRDAEELKHAANELANSEEYFRLLTENGNDLVCTHDLNAKPLYVSPSVERILGYKPQEFLAFPPLALVHPDDLDLVAPRRGAPISERLKRQSIEYRLRHKDGTYRWLEINFGSLKDGSGRIVGVQSSARDVTARRLAEERLAAQAEQLRSLSLRDELTGLHNRRGWLELSGQAVRLATREKRVAAVIFVDLNGMKQINDQYGHEEGDRALRDTANLLRAACREGDVVARFGGDEFVIFALDCSETGLEALRDRTRSATALLNLSGERPFHLSMSFGAAYFRHERPESIEALLDRADTEMYEQKRTRKQNGGTSLMPPSPK